MKKFVWGSIDHQRELFRRLGLNPNQYNPNDDEVVRRFGDVAIRAQLSGMDASGKRLSPDDLELLATLTGRF